MNLKHDHQGRVLEIIASSGPIVLKRTDGSTYRSFLSAPAHVLDSAHQMVQQSAQNLTHRLLLLTVPWLMLFYKLAASMLLTLIIKAVNFVWAMSIGLHYPRPLKPLSSSLWDTNYEKEGILTTPKMKAKELLKNAKLKNKLKHDITWILYAHILTT